MQANKKHITKLINLYVKQPWLIRKKDEVDELLKFCDTSSREELLFSLLSRFVYLSSDVITELLDALVENIFEHWALPPSSVQIVATNPNDDADSSSMMLQMLKPRIASLGVTDVKFVNRLNSSVKNVTDRNNIVIVDEFIGTGSTIHSRVSSLINNIDNYLSQNNQQCDYRIWVCTLVSMEIARPKIIDLSIEYYSPIWLKRGISDHYEGAERDSYIQDMLSLEAQLDQSDAHGDFHSFGWGGAEALYGAENGNAVNSVFPIFWWPYLRSGVTWNTLLSRYE